MNDSAEIVKFLENLKPKLVRTKFSDIRFALEFGEVIKNCFDFLENKSANCITIFPRTDEILDLYVYF